MQKIKRITLTSLLLVAPIMIFAQIGSKKYVTKSKDTTIVVMDQSGLKGEASAFLREEGISQPDKKSRYEVLKEAARETSKLNDNVTELSKEINVAENALEFERSKKNIERNKIEREIERLERKKLLFQDTSQEEMEFLKQKFGDKPSYFLNGMPVDETLISYLPEKEILTRSIKVSNTITGNPNGEIWYVVTKKALEKFGLSTEEESNNEPEHKTYQSKGDFFDNIPVDTDIIEEDIMEKTVPIQIKTATSSTISPEQQGKLAKQQAEVEALKKQINAIRIQQGLEPLDDTDFTQPSENNTANKPIIKEENSNISDTQRRSAEELRKEINTLRIERGLEPLPDTPSQSQPHVKELDINISRDPKMIENTKLEPTTTRETNTEETTPKETPKKTDNKVKEEIVTYSDSPLEKAKHQEEEPKRSVRKIKERERNK